MCQFAEFRQLFARGQQRIGDAHPPQLIDRCYIPSPRSHLRDALHILHRSEVFLEVLPETMISIIHNSFVINQIPHKRRTIVGELRGRTQRNILRLVVGQRVVMFGVEDKQLHERLLVIGYWLLKQLVVSS